MRNLQLNRLKVRDWAGSAPWLRGVLFLCPACSLYKILQVDQFSRQSMVLQDLATLRTLSEVLTSNR